jgi:hypothetical protein
VTLASCAASAHAEPFIETLSWSYTQTVAKLGSPGGFDMDAYGDISIFNGQYNGTNTTCTLTGESDSGYFTQSAPLTLTGQATAVACKWAPNFSTYAVGMCDAGPASPKALFVANFNNLSSLNWQMNFADGTEPTQLPIGIDTDSSNDVQLALNITSTIYTQPFLEFLQVSPNQVIYWYGMDQAMNPATAVHKADQWYVAGQNNNSLSEIGGAMWGLYNSSGARLATGNQDNRYLDGYGDNIVNSYLLAPAPDGSFLVVQNETFNYVTDSSRLKYYHVVYHYSAGGSLLWTTPTANGLVQTVVNQGTGSPTYFYETDGGTGATPGVGMLYQFKDSGLVFEWKKQIYGQTVLPDSTGVFAVGTNPAQADTFLYRLNLSGDILWSSAVTGNKAGGQNYPLGASTLNQKIYLENMIANTGGPTVTLRRYIPGCTLSSITGPATVKSGSTFSVTFNFTQAVTSNSFLFSVQTGSGVTIDNTHSIAVYPGLGATSATLTAKAMTVTKPTNAIIVGMQNGVGRTYEFTIEP